ncbi:MAG: phage terminase small subunit P27 family [Phycisphaerales bacterium]
MGHDRDETSNEPIVEGPGCPLCPPWLDAEAREVWERTAPHVGRMGRLTRADANVLARYCTTFVRWRKAEAFIAKHGEVYPVKSASGTIKCVFAWPQVAIAQKLSATLTRLERELGLTPAARESMEVNRRFDHPPPPPPVPAPPSPPPSADLLLAQRMLRGRGGK